MSAEQSSNGTCPALNEFEFEPKSELGRKLWDIRKRIVASGVPLLD